MNFGHEFNEMFLTRLDDLATLAPLHALEAFQKAQRAAETARMALEENIPAEQQSTITGLVNAFHRMADLQMEFCYRLGMQEGIVLNKPEFLTIGLER